jgi:hypothetical protein
MAHNKYSDMTFDEFKATMTGKKEFDGKVNTEKAGGAREPLPGYFCGGGDPRANFYDPSDFTGTSLPTSYDFRDHYYVPSA